MADLSHLGGLNPVEELDFADYPENKKKESSFQLPPKGVYTLRAPESFTQASFSHSKAGALLVQIDPTIVGPTHEGFTVRFVKVSAKTFDRDGRKASQLGDYLIACGFKGTLSSEQDQADAAEATAGTTFEALLDWRAYNKRTGWSLEGMERFPKNPDGTYQSWVIDPAEVGKDKDGQPIEDASGNPILDEEGNPRRQARVFANLTIPFGGFVPVTE